LHVEPRHIECFDNSNIQGTCCSLRCFQGRKTKQKIIAILTLKLLKVLDFASMEEVVYRRYKRLLDENEPLPNLIIIDGGKGQLSSALKFRCVRVKGKIAIIRCKKKLEELFLSGDSVPLYLDKKSETLKVIQVKRSASVWDYAVG
jgi:excinuclease ABC subunit C